jgi:hypothetical protein
LIAAERFFSGEDVSSTTLEGNGREFCIILFDQILKDIAASEDIAASTHLYTDNIISNIILQNVKSISKSLYFLQTTGSGDFLKLRS